MKNVVLLMLLMGVSVVTVATAQDAAGDIELTRQVIQTQRQAIMTAGMDLTDAEGEAFWTLYREYRGEMAKVEDQRVKVIMGYADKYEVLTDADASGLLKDFFGYRKAQVDLQAKYLKKFEKVLPATKVFRFYQIENKMDAVLNYELASEIPLAE